MTMRFTKIGKTYQLRIETTRDLGQVLELDEALWVATSAPVAAFRCDRKLLELINRDGSGRINTQEMRGAIRWMLNILEDASVPASPGAPLPLKAIRVDSPEGKRLVGSAKDVLATMADKGTAEVSLAQVREYLDKMREKPLNGDGIVVPEAADGDVRRMIEDVLACTGSTEDASGKPGIDEPQLDAFMDAVKGLLEWRAAGSGVNANSLVPFGAETPAIYDLYAAIEVEVDAFFKACGVLQYDGKAGEHFETAKLGDVGAMDRAAMDAWLQERPLARVNAEGRLPLSRDLVNPFYADRIEALRDDVLPRILDVCPDDLGEVSWEAVGAALKPYGDYVRSKKGTSVEKLAPERLAAYRDGGLAELVRKLIEEDLRISEVRAGVLMLERLLLYRGHLLRLADNFVSFGDLYDVSERALFEMGSAVIDGRWFNLAFLVDNVAEHQKMAKDSNIFTLYLEVEGLGGDKPYTVAVPAMTGSKGNLQVGKRGVFFDTEGREHNARVTHIIENPISVREALCVPFVRLWAFLLGKIESMSATSEKALQKKADSMFKAAPPAAGGGKGQFGSAGMMMGLSVSVAAIGSAFAFITKTLTSLSRGQVFLGVLGAALVVMVPVSLIAILKLRRQDLSALLEGCGWAINARMRPTREQRRQFTKPARLPLDAEGTPTRRLLYVLLAIVALLVVALVAQRF
ncbi:MAG: hypothetical protein QGH42_04700 [Kiritimatiellia bacterium]|nr:hypothetical protein [Kiritimatiellia bacterium]MDP6631284.1 hypothetical protein [Kiritimatiellia bacterium]MDP6809615.1 hypothetical protein [Kiritimatiellia bacterium]MDP7023534.1 hypothetical protein [Kiritimatiellia bacterium]